jgi:hypothetical protein
MTTAYSADMVGDKDLIVVDGMEVTGKMARELGLLGQAFLDDDLSAGATARAALQDKQAAHRTPVQKVVDDMGSINKTTSETEEQGDKLPDAYSKTTQGLREAVEGGHMLANEAVVYDTIAAEMAMNGFDPLEVADVTLQLAIGDMDPDTIDAGTKQTLERYEKQVTDAAQKAVCDEVGQDGYGYIKQAMNTSPEVYFAARDFAVRRATGQAAGLTWAHFMEDVREYLGHG